ncbi:MAG: outer membrane lipoprotein-sorting protein [Elusimicrobiaceae bacterium]
MKFLILALFMAGPVFAEAMPDAVKTMEESDRIINPDEPFSVAVTLTDYRGGEEIDSMRLNAYSMRNKYNRRMSTLVDFLSPEKDDGKLMLKEGRSMWFYTPQSSSTVHVSPRQQLLGTAANSDVVAVNLQLDYLPAFEGESGAKDSEGNKRDCLHINLRAKDDKADYLGIQYWIEKDSNLPVSAKYFSDSGRLLKTVFYGKYRKELGRVRPTEMLIMDGVDRRYVTRIAFSDYRFRDIDPIWFEPFSLKNYTREKINIPPAKPLEADSTDYVKQ